MIKVFVMWLIELLWSLSNLIVKPRMLSYDKGLQREINCKNFDYQAYENREKKKFNIPSDQGYEISCELIEAAEEDKSKIAILCHGFGYAKYGSLKYAELFLKLGFTVLMYDHRNHGLSGKAYTTMGYYEKYDLKLVVDWCIKHYGKDCKILTHGESMGGATVLLHLAIDKRVKCVIADCAYSDFRLLLRHQLKQYYHLPAFFIPIESIIIYLRAGFWFKEISPIRAVLCSETPILFIHGKRDNFVPAYMSEQMYACKKDKKALYLVAKAKHAQSYCMNKEGYERAVRRFIDKYF